MATSRKKTSRRSGASRGRKSQSSALIWFLSGLVSGLGICAVLFFGGYLPEKQARTPEPAAQVQPESEPDLTDDPGGIAADDEGNRFDFFTVLPEMEVIVPDQELERSGSGPSAAADSNPGSYILQVGSFRNGADAEQMKARLALLGNVAGIQVVTVNGETWHRVRIGPVTGNRRADEIRRSLQDNGIDTLVMKDSN